MKKFVLFFIFLFIFPFFLLGCSNKTQDHLSNYSIFVDFDETKMEANCFEEVEYFNNSENFLTSICFHLYPNAFREDAVKSVVTSLNKEKAYPNGESFGKILIQDVKLGENRLQFEITGDDNNILEVFLQDKLYPDESVKVSIDFYLILPNLNHRFGYGENTINFGNFYPILCVYENERGFLKDLYSSNGDPFYSDVSNYNVNITYNKNYTLASTGQQINKSYKDSSITSQVTAKCVRDFCFVLSDKFLVLEDDFNDTKIRYYYYDDPDPEKALTIAKEAFAYFNQIFGEYPYKDLSVVRTNFLHGGMEYPNLVMISDSILDSVEYNYAIVHEIAHQWWYGIVGNDEYNEAWVDESLTEYSSLMFFEKNSGYNVDYNLAIENANSSYKFFVEVYSNIYDKLDTSMNRSLDEFKTEPEYVNCIYTKGVLMYDTIRSIVGEKKFLKTLEIYYNKYKYKNANGFELIDVFKRVCGSKIEDIFDCWVKGKVVII